MLALGDGLVQLRGYPCATLLCKHFTYHHFLSRIPHTGLNMPTSPLLSLAAVDHLIDYTSFKPHLHGPLVDSSLSDADLELRARNFLTVLDSKFRHGYNTPAWTGQLYKGMFSVKRTIDAMYETADLLGLRSGRRYVCLRVHLCVRTAADQESTSKSGGPFGI
ncbi:hypothetical protein L226DRAFT_390841 [Lentinus tigrinus ALCF2SS1-7]|uniref:uncharacterized protein n=1 Tax=Lentinus tigrinus ALCF2SS1-7 TaxID=1328758 RepID=UPI001165EDF5|nr:hypothetical protein L226DRAFT_390841 [Lentinus tigrinus ALCF2SS1-7]